MSSRPWHAHYDAGVSPALAFAPLPLPEFLRRSAREHGARPALLFQNARLT